MVEPAVPERPFDLSHGAAKVCREMAERGAAMLRFDMAGLGQSEGDIADMNFTTRIGDIMAQRA